MTALWAKDGRRGFESVPQDGIEVNKGFSLSEEYRASEASGHSLNRAYWQDVGRLSAPTDS